MDMPGPLQGTETIMVTAHGRGGADVRASVVVTKSEMDADGNEIVSAVVSTKSLDEDPDAADVAEGNIAYMRDVNLGGLDDGDYMVTVNIGDDMLSIPIEVVNDRTPPMLSKASAWPAVVKDGDQVALRVVVTSVNEIVSVTADVSALDSTRMEPLMLSEQPDEAGVYTRLFTIASEGNTNDDGEITITFKATDRIDSESADDAASMATITLENDPSELTDAEVTPGSGKPGETIWIKATGSEGGDAEATVNNAETGMMIAQVTLDEDAANAGMYSGGLMIVEDAHPAGMYDVTVTLGTKEKTLEDALTIEPPGYDFTMSIGAGTHLIHVPLDVTQVNGADMMISTVRDLYNALGDAVSIIISLGADGSWNSYLGDDAPGMAFGDMMLGDSTGLVAVMNSAVTLELTGNALGTGGVSTISLNAGNNLVGVPLDSAQIGMISDVLGTLVSAVVVSNEAGDGFPDHHASRRPGRRSAHGRRRLHRCGCRRGEYTGYRKSVAEHG